MLSFGRRKTRRIVSFLLMALMALGPAASAFAADSEAYARSAKGMVKSTDTIDVFAPVGGQVLPFDWETGDTVESGDPLVSVRPKQIFAANDGIIRSLRGEIGDQASDVIEQYGALLYIDRTDVMWVYASTSKAYDKPENRAITIGETLRVYNGKESNPLSTKGTVISVDGKEYVVEIPSDVFDLEDDVKLYRGEDGAYRSGDKVGEGEAKRAEAIKVSASGTIAGIYVTEGQKVSRGDALFTLDSADTIYESPVSTSVSSPRKGVISACYVSSGQRVEKDQLLFTLMPLDSLEFQVDVDELDIASLAPGMAVQVKVDALGDAMIPAVVEEIHPLGIEVLDTTKFHVTLKIQSTVEGLLPGMRVTAYWEGSTAPSGN